MPVAADSGGGGSTGVLMCDYGGLHTLLGRIKAAASPVGGTGSTVRGGCSSAVDAAGQFGSLLTGATELGDWYGGGMPGLQDDLDGQAAFLNTVTQSISWTDTTVAGVLPG